MQTDALLHLNLNRRGRLSRRNFLQTAALGVGGSSLLSQFRLHAEDLKKEGRSCILLWLAGAPSQLETWDPKPGTPNGGETKKIQTQTPGVEIAHHWPKIAGVMNEIAVIRAMTGKEAAHERGTYHLHTGHRMMGIEKFPHFGSVVARELGDPQSDIPNFVSIGQTLSSGFLGVQVAPFIIDRPGMLPDNVVNTTSDVRQRRRLALLSQQENEFSQAGATALVKEQSELYQKANLMMTSPRLKAFQFDDEPAATNRTGPAGCPSAGRSGRPVCRSPQHRLGHACQSLPQHGASRPGSRSGTVPTPAGSQTTGTAGKNAGTLHGRIRSHPQNQCPPPCPRS